MRRLFAVLLTVCMAFILFTSTSYAQETTEAQIVAEAFELTEIRDGKLSFKVKLRNISCEDRSLHFDYQLLDQNGDIICSAACGTSTIVAAGQAIWAGPYGVKNEHIDEAVSMRFVSSKYFPKGEEIYLKEKATFPLFEADNRDNGQGSKEAFVLRDNEDSKEIDNETADDPIKVEDVIIRKSSSGYRIGIKVRNTGETAREIIQLNLQVLDAAGDVLTNVDTNVYNLEAGQAGKTEYKRINCKLDEIGSIRVFGYRYGTGTDIVTHFDSKERYKLITPIIVLIDDITIE